MEAARVLDETSFKEIESTMHYVEEARARAERAVKEMRQMGAEPHLIAATVQAEEELSDLARRFRQGTYFAVPRNQTSF
ncbi:hypothetical protein BH20ACT15_BH20ACT15_14800 [soil metagenome]